MIVLPLLLSVVMGYLLGSVSFAILTSKIFRLADPRSYGSRNPGATNVLRSGNKAAATLTLVGDAMKGGTAVWIVKALAPQFGVSADSLTVIAAAAGLGAFVGHLYPLYHRFAGGKGVATFFGVLLAFNPWFVLAVGAVWLLVASVFRYSSVASLTSAAVAPILHAIVWSDPATTLVVIAMAILLAIRHRENIVKLRAGTESKLGKKPA